MAEINLIKIDGKPIQKLIEVISNGVGTIYKPRAIKKEAEAEAYRIEIIERAKSKALSEGKQIEAETYNRLQERILFQEIKRQSNIDNVSQIAAEQLSQETIVSEEPVDNDWATRFFNIVEDISDEEMQKLWGRILAGEVKQPKSYSLRTLEFLKNISKTEAETFSKFGKLALTSNNTSFIINFKNESLLEKKYQFLFKERLLLEELGILLANDLVYKLKPVEEDELSNDVFTYGNYCIIAERKKRTPQQTIPALVFTKIGQELLSLIEIPFDYEYVQLLATKLKTDGVSIKYGDIINLTDEFIEHGDLKEVH